MMYRIDYQAEKSEGSMKVQAPDESKAMCKFKEKIIEIERKTGIRLRSLESKIEEIEPEQDKRERQIEWQKDLKKKIDHLNESNLTEETYKEISNLLKDTGFYEGTLITEDEDTGKEDDKAWDHYPEGVLRPQEALEKCPKETEEEIREWLKENDRSIDYCPAFKEWEKEEDLSNASYVGLEIYLREKINEEKGDDIDDH